MTHKRKAQTIAERIYQRGHLHWCKTDLIYRILMNRDTTELDSILKKELDVVKTVHPNLGKLFNDQMHKILTDKQLDTRIPKHGWFFILLWMNISKTMVDDLMDNKVPPLKFKLFYDDHLSKYCNELFLSKINCLQQFVEKVRSIYVTL